MHITERETVSYFSSKSNRTSATLSTLFAKIFFILAALSFRINAQEQSGVLTGEVRDAVTKQPLPSATVTLVGTSHGAAADIRGAFVVKNIPPGTYQVRSSYIGYTPIRYDDIIVAQSRSTSLTIELFPSQVEMNEVSVTGDYFQRPSDRVTSLRTLTPQEIRRSPGSAEDIFRVMQSLPGVATAGGKSAQLIVRGGSPDENLTLLDNIEIYNPIHFARTGESMGIISIVNPSLLKSVDFMTGGFPAVYGDKMSSVFEMSLVDGNKELHNVDVNTNVAGFGALIDGPAPGGGSMVFSARRGFFDLLTSIMNRPAAPRYYDAVGKATYDLDANNRVSFVGFYYLDQIERVGSTKESAAQSKYDYLTRDDYGSAFGVNWRSLVTSHAYALTTLSFSGNGWNTLQGTSNDPSLRGEHTRENNTALKSEITGQVLPSLELKAGFQAHLIGSSHDTWKPEDTTRAGVIIPASTISYNPAESQKVSAFVQDTWQPFDRLVLTSGVRYDYFTSTSQATWSPRLALLYHVAERTSLTLSYGKFYQTPASYQIALDLQNEFLQSSRATHYVAGVEHLVSEDTRATVEVYYKDLSQVIVGSDTSDVLTNAGSGFAQGIEFSLQKKFTDGFVGSASYSYSVSKRRDQGSLPLYFFEFDRPHIVNLIAGMELGAGWQLGAKFQYASGNPYTPVVGVVKKSGVNYLVDGEPFSARYPDYHKLDIRLDRKFTFGSWTLTAYLDLWNVYNRDNILSYSYNVSQQGTVTTTPRFDFGVLPIFGLTAQF
ncbi:MAG: TonB-dependent receptor [Bacteroidota bacterium]